MALGRQAVTPGTRDVLEGRCAPIGAPLGHQASVSEQPEISLENYKVLQNTLHKLPLVSQEARDKIPRVHIKGLSRLLYRRTHLGENDPRVEPGGHLHEEEEIHRGIALYKQVSTRWHRSNRYL